MVKRIKKFWKWVKSKKYYFLSIFCFLFILWFFCLPKSLFEVPYSTIIYDKNGELLNARIAHDGQWRFPDMDSVPVKFEKAIIQFEDRSFYSHLGISIKGLGRAISQNISAGHVVSGGSTITMQVIRMSRRKPRTLWQKVVEMFMATRLEFRYSNEEILNMYASHAPMGGNVVGLEAASWRYFGRNAHQLSWAESALLAVLPNAPSMLHLSKNRKALIEKRNRLLKRLLENKDIDQLTYDLSVQEPLPGSPKSLPQYAPHLTNYLIKAGHEGQKTYSTIDLDLQKRTEQILENHHQRLKQNQVFNGAVVITDYQNGAILAYVGNTSVQEKEHGGDNDMIQAPRSSGSILKPFLYNEALTQGMILPTQLLADVPTTMAGYSPINYNKQFDGAVPSNEALSRSLNIPFVLLLRKYGVAPFKEDLKDYGLTTITRSSSNYGLSLILGGAEVKLIDLVNGYGKLGKRLSDNNYYQVKYQIDQELDTTVNKLNKGASYLTLEAMKKVKRPYNQQGWKEFTSSKDISWKTGTSYGFRDAWAVGLDSKYVVGVWVGNADGEGRPGIIGVEASAPILFDVFDQLPKQTSLARPVDDIKKVEVCVSSGYVAKPECTTTQLAYAPIIKKEFLACPYHKILHLDKTKSYRVTSNCYSVSDMVDTSWFILPPKMENYFKKRNPNYQELPEFINDCEDKKESNRLIILYPKNKSHLIIPKGVKGEKEKVVFEAVHQRSESLLYWYLDEEYLGETKDIHQLEYLPSKGDHTLSIFDEYGSSTQITFEVVNE